MIVHVTRRHVLTGCRYSPNRCPIHSAIVEALGDRLQGWELSVTQLALRFYLLDPASGGFMRLYEIETPDVVGEAITRFDIIGELEPFRFELDDAALAQLDQTVPVSAGRR